MALPREAKSFPGLCHRTELDTWTPAPEYDPVITVTLVSALWWHSKFPAEVWWALNTLIFYVGGVWCVSEMLTGLPGRELNL